MDDLISKKAIWDEAHKLAGPMTGDGWDNWGVYALIERQPTIKAVPLEPLCKFLAGIYGAPCQLGEIECYPQCDPDAEGMCLGMRSNDETCWRSYLTKWMGGQA